MVTFRPLYMALLARNRASAAKPCRNNPKADVSVGSRISFSSRNGQLLPAQNEKACINKGDPFQLVYKILVTCVPT